MTIKHQLERRLARLEAMSDDGQLSGVQYSIDGVIPDAYVVRIGTDAVETISRFNDEKQDAFETRASALLEAYAHQQRRSGLMPTMWPVMPPVTADEYISPATGKPIVVTIGGQQ